VSFFKEQKKPPKGYEMFNGIRNSFKLEMESEMDFLMTIKNEIVRQ